jgi:hypothetical protein
MELNNMKTTNEGFLVNTLRRIPRHGVKALAAGAVLIAAALPLAVASSAGAATTLGGATVYFATDSSDGGNGTQTLGDDYSYFGTGGSGTIQIEVLASADLANDGGNVSLTTNAPGVTFSSVTESATVGGAGSTSNRYVTAYFASTSASVPGTYNLTLVDDGTSMTGVTDPGAFSITPSPSVSSMTSLTAGAATLANGAASANFLINGAGFETGNTTTGITTPPYAVLTSTVNGTTLDVGSGETTVESTIGTQTYGNYQGTQLEIDVTPENSLTFGPATVGTYNLTVNDEDGGTVTFPNAFTITGDSITNDSPSGFIESGATPTVSVTLLGSGFQQGAVVSFPGCSEVLSTSVNTTWNSATSLTASFTQEAGTSVCATKVVNPAAPNGNGATFTLNGSLGFGSGPGNDPATVKPIITGTSDTTPIVPGSPASTVTLTGSGFSILDNTFVSYVGNSYLTLSPNTATGVTLSSAAGNTGTSLTLTESILSATTTPAGDDAISIESSTPFPAAIIVAGPVITSQSPVDIPFGTPIGTVITLTGTGFTSTLAGTVTQGTAAGFSFNGHVNYVNATTVDVVVTAMPVPADALPVPASVTVNESLIGGTGTAESQPFFFIFGSAPTITGITYATGTSGVGAGATAQTVTIQGSNFKTGVTVGPFLNVNSVTDSGVTAKVLSINAGGTAITASIAIAATDTNTLDSFSVVNTDGGTAKSGVVELNIQPAPTITSVAPTTASANATTAFTLTGTNFAAGASVSATADGTCGVATVVSATSVTVSCTFGAATSAAALTLTNANGGVATSATVLASSTAPAGGAPHATGEAGSAIIGRTVDIAVAGVGFYGQPSVTSTGNSVKAVVSKDNGTLMTVRVTVGKTTGPGEHTLTFTLANGDVFKVNYAIIK